MFLDCSGNCKTCNDWDVCKECQPGLYHYADGTCNICPEGLYEHSDSSCHSCVEGQYEHSDGTCHICIEGFYEYPDGSCHKCAEGDYEYPDGTCHHCPEGLYEHSDSSCHSCAESQHEYSDGTCHICIEGFYEYPDGSCHKCAQGYYEQLDGSCITCQNMNPDGSCQKCPGSYFQYPNESCIATCSYPFIQDTSASFPKCIYYQPSSSQNNVENAVGGMQVGAMAVTQVVTTLSSSSPGGIMIGVAGRIFFLVKFLNISRSREFEHALETWKSNFVPIDFNFIMPAKMEENIELRPLPEIFEKRGTPSSFLVNSWDNIVMLITLVLILISLRLLRKFISKGTKILGIIKSLNVGVQNYLLTQLYAMYGDVIFYIILDLRALKLGHWSSVLSFPLTLIFLIIIIASFTLHFNILYNYQKIKKEAKSAKNNEALLRYKEENKGFGLLFQEFNDEAFGQQSFLLFLTVRDMLLSFIIGVIYELTLAQVMLFLLLNVMGLVYLARKKPFKSKFDEIQQYAYESIVLLVSFIEFIGCIFAGNSSQETRTKTVLGKFLISLNITFNMTSLSFMLIKLAMIVKEAYDGYKAKQKLTKPTLRIQNPSRSAEAFTETKSNSPESFQSQNIAPDISWKQDHELSMIGLKEDISFADLSMQNEGNLNQTPDSLLKINRKRKINQNLIRNSVTSRQRIIPRMINFDSVQHISKNTEL